MHGAWKIKPLEVAKFAENGMGQRCGTRHPNAHNAVQKKRAWASSFTAKDESRELSFSILGFNEMAKFLNFLPLGALIDPNGVFRRPQTTRAFALPLEPT